MKEMKETQSDIKYNIEWTTFGKFLEYLENKGIYPNIASFVGAATVRVYTIGYEDRAPSEIEMDSMKILVRQAMEEGALGLVLHLFMSLVFRQNGGLCLM